MFYCNVLTKLGICLQDLAFFHLRFYLQTNLSSFDFQQFTWSNVAKVHRVEESLKTDFDERITLKTTMKMMELLFQEGST